MTKKLALALLVLTACTVMAQMSTHPQRVTAPPLFTVRVNQGSSAPVRMTFRVAPGFHINSSKPSSELLLPTVVKFSVPTDISVAKLTYPEGQLLSFPFSPDEKLSVYAGDFTVEGLVNAARSTPKGHYRVHGTLRYQACDDRACYPPTTIPLAFDVLVDKSSAAKKARGNPAQSPHIHK